MLTLFVTLIIIKIFNIRIFKLEEHLEKFQKTINMNLFKKQLQVLRPLVIAVIFILYSVQGAAQPGRVKSYQKISATQGNLTGLTNIDAFCTSGYSISDFDGDDNNDVMVAPYLSTKLYMCNLNIYSCTGL